MIMASPAYLTIIDDQGQQVKANVKIKGREGSAEVLAFNYDVEIPSDKNTGALTAVRKHNAAVITKTFDSASPVLFDAVCRGKTMQQMKLDWYQINDKGEEEVYFTHTLTGVKVVKLYQYMKNVKNPENDGYSHQEDVHVRFKKIEVKYPDGNIEASDDWTESRTST